MPLTTFLGVLVALGWLLWCGESLNIEREHIQLRNEISSQLEELELSEGHLSERNFIDSDKSCPSCSNGFECCVQKNRIGCCRKPVPSIDSDKSCPACSSGLECCVQKNRIGCCRMPVPSIDSDKSCPACSSGLECCVQKNRIGCCRKIQKKSSILDTAILTSCLNQEYELHQCQVKELQKLNEEFKNPRVKDTCEVRLRSYSFNNQPTVDRYGFIRVNGKDVMKVNFDGTAYNRGVNTVVLDPKSCLPGVQQWFDTCGSATRTRDLNRYLESLPTGTILLGVTFDEPSYQLAAALPLLRSMGVDVYSVGDRGMFAFVLQKGYPSKTVLDKSPSRTTALELAVQLSGFINHIQISRRT